MPSHPPHTPEALIAVWQHHVFESSPTRTPDFNAFARQFTTVLRRTVSPQFSVPAVSIGHFILSGFLRHRDSGAFVFWSVSDVRFLRDAWYRKIMIRTATDPHDHTGGPNHYTTLSDLLADATDLVERSLIVR